MSVPSDIDFLAKTCGCMLVLPQVKSDDKTHHLLANKIMRMPLVPHEEPVDDVTQRARR